MYKYVTRQGQLSFFDMDEGDEERDDATDDLV